MLARWKENYPAYAEEYRRQLIDVNETRTFEARNSKVGALGGFS